MIPKQAIEKALEGGYKRTHVNYKSHLGRWHLCELVIDPTFWQALGKALGWDTLSDRTSLSEKMFWGICKTEAHRFYDLILEGKDTADYWKELLNKPV